MEMHAPILLIIPFCGLEILSLFLFPGTLPLLTWKSLLCVVARIPVRSDPWLAVHILTPFLPIPFSPSSTVPLLKCMPFYDDIAISASHSPIQLVILIWLDFYEHHLLPDPVQYTPSPA